MLFDIYHQLDVEDVAEKFRKTGVSIYADEDKRTYKSLYNILEELSEKIDFEDGD